MANRFKAYLKEILPDVELEIDLSDFYISQFTDDGRMQQTDENIEMMPTGDEWAVKLFLAGIITRLELIEVLQGRKEIKVKDNKPKKEEERGSD